MGKGLEALKNLVERQYLDEEGQEEYDIIEKELKRLEQLEIMYYNCVIEGTKQKKILEIIKKYFVFHHIGTDTGNKTFHIIATSKKLIPAEDYYSLKEELL